MWLQMCQHHSEWHVPYGLESRIKLWFCIPDVQYLDVPVMGITEIWQFQKALYFYY